MTKSYRKEILKAMIDAIPSDADPNTIQENLLKATSHNGAWFLLQVVSIKGWKFSQKVIERFGDDNVIKALLKKVLDSDCIKKCINQQNYHNKTDYLIAVAA